MADCVEALRVRPAQLGARLDLADALERGRKKGLATWVRWNCAEWQAFDPIESTFPSNNVWSNVRWSSFLHRPPGRAEEIAARWAGVRPLYWTDPEHLRTGAYFGRWVFTCWAANSSGNEASIRELASLLWLEDAWRDGFLELIEFNLGDAGTAAGWLELPEALRALPWFLNGSRTFDTKMDVSLVRQLVSSPTMIGLYLPNAIFPRAVVTDLPALAPGLQFLAVEMERRNRDHDALVNGLASLPSLRFLSLHGNAIGDDHLPAIAAAPGLSALGIASQRLTDRGLLALGSMPHLRHLGLNSREITRPGLAEFRRAFPRVNVHLSEDMLNRLGPA